MSVLFEINGMCLISATADFIRRYASYYVIRHLNWSLLSVLTLKISDLKISFTDFKPSINTFLRNKWQMSWNAAVLNKLRSIKPSLGE